MAVTSQKGASKRSPADILPQSARFEVSVADPSEIDHRRPDSPLHAAPTALLRRERFGAQSFTVQDRRDEGNQGVRSIRVRGRAVPRAILLAEAADRWGDGDVHSPLGAKREQARYRPGR